MCDSCSDIAVKIINDDYYNTMSELRTDVLDSEEVRDVYGEAYEELLQGYATFHKQVFDGMYDNNVESIQRRQQQWEEQFDVLLEQIESFKNGEVDHEEESDEQTPDSDELHQNTSTIATTAFKIAAPGGWSGTTT